MFRLVCSATRMLEYPMAGSDGHGSVGKASTPNTNTCLSKDAKTTTVHSLSKLSRARPGVSN